VNIRATNFDRSGTQLRITIFDWMEPCEHVKSYTDARKSQMITKPNQKQAKKIKGGLGPKTW